jgi:hypothetical protein
LAYGLMQSCIAMFSRGVYVGAALDQSVHFLQISPHRRYMQRAFPKEPYLIYIIQGHSTECGKFLVFVAL